jgi:CBS domain-containing protein
MIKVRNLMTEDVVTVGPYTTLRDLVSVLRDEGVAGVPVLSGGKVVGVVSATDLMEFEASTPGVPAARPEQAEWGEVEVVDDWEDDDSITFYTDLWPDVGTDVLERFEETRSPEWDLLQEHVVAEIMTQRVRAIAPDRTARDAARMMREASVHRILVMDGERLAGILSASDIVNAVADELV